MWGKCSVAAWDQTLPVACRCWHRQCLTCFQVSLEESTEKALGAWAALGRHQSTTVSHLQTGGGHGGCGKEEADVREVAEEEPQELVVRSQSGMLGFSRLDNESTSHRSTQTGNSGRRPGGGGWGRRDNSSSHLLALRHLQEIQIGGGLGPKRKDLGGG